MSNEQGENKIEGSLIPRDISSDYERIMSQEHGVLLWQEFLNTLKNERFLILKIDLSKETDRDVFVRKANFMKAFRQGGISRKHPENYPGQRRVAIIRCTREQYHGSDPTGRTSTGWAANAFSSDVEWEEAAK